MCKSKGVRGGELFYIVLRYVTYELSYRQIINSQMMKEYRGDTPKRELDVRGRALTCKSMTRDTVDRFG